MYSQTISEQNVIALHTAWGKRHLHLPSVKSIWSLKPVKYECAIIKVANLYDFGVVCTPWIHFVQLYKKHWNYTIFCDFYSKLKHQNISILSKGFQCKGYLFFLMWIRFLFVSLLVLKNLLCCICAFQLIQKICSKYK